MIFAAKPALSHRGLRLASGFIQWLIAVPDNVDRDSGVYFLLAHFPAYACQQEAPSV